MFMRVFVSATTLMWLQVCGAQAGGQHGVRQRMSCSEVRYYVAKYSIATAEMYARSQGATNAQINAARRCLTDEHGRRAQRS
jgi:hypothetical protein